MAQRIVINQGIGGFELSQKALRALIRRGCTHIETIPPDAWGRLLGHEPLTESGEVILDHHRHENRDCPNLVEVVEKLGKQAWGEYGKLKIVSIPDGIEWHIREHEEGTEHIAEDHRMWD